MKKVDPQNLYADWDVVAKRPPWKHVTSAELAVILGKHLQTINNWKVRGILPMPDGKSRVRRGNKNYFRIASIRAWLESRPEAEIINEWVRHDFGCDTMTDGQAQNLLRTYYKVSL